MNLRHFLATLLAACHLGLVICGAARVSLFPDTPCMRNPLAYYGAVSGADNGYGFFAPGVSSQWRVTFAVQDETGQQCSLAPDEGSTREVDVRIGTTFFLLRYEKLWPYYAASRAANAFGSCPEAEQIMVGFDLYELPTMTEYRAGQRPYWSPMYQATFAQHSEFRSQGE